MGVYAGDPVVQALLPNLRRIVTASSPSHHSSPSLLFLFGVLGKGTAMFGLHLSIQPQSMQSCLFAHPKECSHGSLISLCKE